LKKEQRGVMATQTATATAAEAKQYTVAEKNACSIDAMLNGGTCEACQ
jgi:ribonucleoside-diphosphate reductase alpha chain